MSKSVLAALAAVALAASAGQVLANEVQPARAVSTAQVDFRDEAAVKALYARLTRSAKEVCDSNSANPRIAQGDRLCVQRAVAEAVRTVNKPLLTARHEQASSPIQFATRGY